MTALKTAIAPDVSLLVDGELANAGDVTTAITDIQSALRNGRLSVTDNDTHVGTLNEKLTVSGGGITKSEQDDGADETLQLTLSTALEALNLLLPASGKIRVTAMDSNGANSGYVPVSDGANGVSWAAQAGGGAQPVDRTGTAGENLSERDMVFLDESDGMWYKLDTDATSTVLAGSLKGCVNESGGITSSSTGSIRILGEVSGFSGLTAEGRVYASTTPGGYTQTKPDVTSGGGQIAVAEMGYAVSETAILIQPKPIRYIKRESLANDGTLTIEHHSDVQSRHREVRAYVGTTVAGSSLASYADSNQDVDVGLRDRSPATYGSDVTSGQTVTATAGVSGFEAPNAIDDDNGTAWQTDSGETSETWKIDYGSGNEKTIQQYTMRPRDSFPTRAPADWTLQGSNDDTNWDILDTHSSYSSWVSGTTETFTFTNATAYRYYQIVITADGGNGRLSISEIEMMEVATYNDGADKLAQSFQVTGAQTLKTINLWLKKVGSPTGTLTLRIETDNSGEPSGTLVDANATATVAESSLSTSYGDITFTFTNSFSISGSTTYWIVLSTDRAVSETNYVQWGADGSSPSYADGEMMNETSSSWTAESKDAVFEIFAEGTQYDEPAVIGRWSGGTRDIAVRFDDGAASDPNTKTTFKNVSGSTLDIVAEVEVA